MQQHTSIHLTTATKITLLRILGIPVFILMVIYYKIGLAAGDPQEYQRYIALLLFVLIALTDALDGYLARVRDEVTRLGAILDPIADKALLLSALILLTRPSLPALQPQIPVFFALLIISRDVVLIAGAYLINWMTGHVEIRPRISGKIATVLQMICIAWVLADGHVKSFMVLVWVATAFTALSFIQYLRDGIHQLEKQPSSSGYGEV
jgi:cardiolipin synthase (CMP-forming)